jgi:hypothetical protein
MLNSDEWISAVGVSVPRAPKMPAGTSLIRSITMLVLPGL